MDLLLIAIGVIAASGAPGLLLSRRSGFGQALATVLCVGGSALGITQTSIGAFEEKPWEVRLPWSVPESEFHLALDGISAWFLLPIFLISALGSVYGLGYWKQADHPNNGRRLRLFFGLMTAAMAFLVLARNAVLFLGAWEIVALSAFFLVRTEDEEKPARDAAWLFLAASHLATLCLFAMFALLRGAAGSFTLTPLTAGSLAAGSATAIFLLALAGFGLNAGLMPSHVWLPSAHAMAPSHVSALLSGVLLEMGMYGLVRIYSLLPEPPAWWGGLLLALGVASGVLGAAFAIGQRDLKRVLAYHSIANIGIIVMGLGLAMVGRSLGRADWILLGLGGALLHVWNHALFQSLLFLSAGSVIQATHTRDIDRLGGLGKTMPRTAFCFLIGAVAICGLPPLNGFVSVLLIYLGLFHTLKIIGETSWASAAFAIPALAWIGTLAVASFVKVYGVVFLGAGRSEHVRQAREAGIATIGPMAVLALCCLAIGLAPTAIVPLLERALRDWTGRPVSLNLLVDLKWISVAGVILILLLGFLAWLSSWFRLFQQGSLPSGSKA